MSTLTVEEVTLLVGAVTAASAIVGATLGAVVSYRIARQQLRATVRSSNRQEWINTVRDTTAEITGLVFAVSAMADLKGGGQSQITLAAEHVNRLGFLQRKLDLLLNPNEADHVELMESVNKYVLGSLYEATGKNPSHQIDVGEESARVTRLAQVILKREWERVKRGQ